MIKEWDNAEGGTRARTPLRAPGSKPGVDPNFTTSAGRLHLALNHFHDNRNHRAHADQESDDLQGQTIAKRCFRDVAIDILFIAPNDSAMRAPVADLGVIGNDIFALHTL